ncbi:MAG: hypothetical protein C4539_19590 [Ignavibacteriales bacterium]|nr:MAG: hypothetical protein C4539_19590 [Ignavibacteriales bacterium]
MDSLHYPGIDDVIQIASIDDPQIRNLLITQCYYEISRAFAERIAVDANWCTFATWASKQAGQTIRKEDFIKAVKSKLNIQPWTEEAINKIILAAFDIGSKQNENYLQKSIWKALNITALDKASDSVARGNKKVFEEIGKEFVRFILRCFPDEVYNQNSINEFCAGLKPGLPPDGQQYLLNAFTRYYQALFEEDNKKKAELILLANLEVGFHEQTRLQPEIADSLNVALVEPKEFRNKFYDEIYPTNTFWNRIKTFFLRLFGRLTDLDSAIEQFVNFSQHNLRLIITEHLMSISFPPDIRIQLGKDLTAEFPVILQKLENTELNMLLNKVDPTPNSLLESGAIDWADLPERIHFIADLFRCYQESNNLFKEPFSPEQVMEIRAGSLPAGKL